MLTKLARQYKMGLALLTLLAGLCVTLVAAEQAHYSRLVFPGPAGKLVYQTYDAQGDTIPDFSNCGYGGGGVAIPLVPVKVTMQPLAGEPDDLTRLQAAINQVAALPRGADGWRGAVLLERGTYRLGGTLKIAASGIVVRGAGESAAETILLGTARRGYSLVAIGGPASAQPIAATRQKIMNDFVPVGSHTLDIADGSKFKAGDKVFILRHGDAAWIHDIKMDQIMERPGHPHSTKQWQPFDLRFDRMITAVNGNRLTLDAPIACAVEAQWGGGEVVKYNDTGRIEQAGLENLRAVSEFDHTRTAAERGKKYFSDEAHANYLVSFDNVENAWARHLTTLNFVQGVATCGGGAKWVTVEDSSALDPVSILTGGRRYAFNLNSELTLVQRCYARDARHAFVVGARVAGPNVFLNCKAERNHATSEPHHRWSVGGLYDEVDAPIAIQDRQWMGSGHGWAGANYVAWNCAGSLVCEQPPTAQNFAIGFVGTKGKKAFQRPDGYWESFGHHVTPDSLYLKQLEDRLGPQAVQNMAQ